ncbi:MAG: hypothetical protein RLZZ50_1698 [Verrucomicrobiota bacterium]
MPPRRLQAHLGKTGVDPGAFVVSLLHAVFLRAGAADAIPFPVPPRLPAMFFAALLVVAPAVRAVEVQAHGLAFEHWVCDTFFGGYRPDGYTQKWDVPAAANRLADPGLSALPVNPKATRFGAPVGLGDALRQFDIGEPFLLILGYWEQTGPGEKRFVKILAPRVEPAAWRALWGPVTRADLERLDAVVKDRSLTPAETRRRAQSLKDRPPFSRAVFVLNPKIDEKGQRRLQCSLRYADVLKHLAPDSSPGADESPSLWGVPFPGPVESGPRRFPKGETVSGK